MTGRPKVLSLDWDIVTGDCRESGVCCGGCGWKCGLTGENGRPRTKRVRGSSQCMNEEWMDRAKKFEKMCRRFQYKKGCLFYVAENHATIYRVMPESALVWNYDNHYDDSDVRGFYTQSGLDCSNWVSWCVEKKGIKVRYNNDKIKKAGLTGNVDMVFLCLSSPYTTSKADNEFYRFISVMNGIVGKPKFIGHMGQMLSRKYASYLRRVKK